MVHFITANFISFSFFLLQIVFIMNTYIDVSITTGMNFYGLFMNFFGKMFLRSIGASIFSPKSLSKSIVTNIRKIHFFS